MHICDIVTCQVFHHLGEKGDIADGEDRWISRMTKEQTIPSTRMKNLTSSKS